VAKLCASYHLPLKSFSPDFFEFLNRYEWPGNVRELVNALERAVAAARQEPVLFPKHLPVYIRVHLARASVNQDSTTPGDALPRVSAHPGETLPRLVDLRESTISDLEQTYLRELMTRATTMQEACAISGLSRSRLYALLKKHALPSCFRMPAP
jgi:two-component system NtrC family response regulator